jgi:hypothetical protein
MFVSCVEGLVCFYNLVKSRNKQPGKRLSRDDPQIVIEPEQMNRSSIGSGPGNDPVHYWQNLRNNSDYQ